ncbi:N(6)-adenosine-methyltransferase catalytic subunit METTL3-like [Convolutriloba macropyga]|uniref:N(6)-adenosine-methyltransferase catalytic subunit METTL3-like n=1 Tax=Convolutriloba macropyga TaxID=536237 RepID=UPI003F521AB6
MRLLLKDELKFPLTLAEITKLLKETVGVDISNLHNKVRSTLEKLDNQKLIRFCLDTNMITFVNFFTLRDVYQYKEENLEDTGPVSEFSVSNRKRALTDVFPDIPTKVPRKDYVDYWKDKAQELIAYKSFKERQHYETARQIHDLISTPTAKEMMKLEKFKCQEQRIIEFCTHLTLFECKRKQRFAFMTSKSPPKNTFCKKLHYRPVNNASTERKLGDCSFLNTCFHMETCKYIHYELDLNERCMKEFVEQDAKNVIRSVPEKSIVIYPPQWIQCDVRSFDMTCLGKFSVIMADPPWDIHMELPYGTMSDKEMIGLPIPELQEEGFIFLWVTGRAMEIGRECLKQWGYSRCEDLIWVKINQLGKLIRTGRTGHWINHGKEHCLVGIKGNPVSRKANTRCLDTDVLISEVRETSHKPDEIYGVLERLSPGTRKLELFGRMHNTRPNWITLGNQTDGVRLLDPKVIRDFRRKYPDGNALKPRKYTVSQSSQD